MVEQFAIDYNCTIDDFQSKETLITLLQKRDGSRRFNNEDGILNILTYSGKLVITAGEEILPWCEEVLRKQISAEDEKLLINCGSWHAQLIPHWVKGSNRNFRWLGMRLVNYFNERPDGFYSIAVTAYSGELKSNISSSNRKEFSLIQSRSNYKLIPALYKAYGDRNVFLDYVPFSDSDIKITVDYPYNTVMLKPNEQFNGLFVYPKVTVPDELKYFEN